MMADKIKCAKLKMPLIIDAFKYIDFIYVDGNAVDNMGSMLI
jgi:hypothetical protein